MKLVKDFRLFQYLYRHTSARKKIHTTQTNLQDTAGVKYSPFTNCTLPLALLIYLLLNFLLTVWVRMMMLMIELWHFKQENQRHNAG